MNPEERERPPDNHRSQPDPYRDKQAPTGMYYQTYPPQPVAICNGYAQVPVQQAYYTAIPGVMAPRLLPVVQGPTFYAGYPPRVQSPMPGYQLAQVNPGSGQQPMPGQMPGQVPVHMPQRNSQAAMTVQPMYGYAQEIPSSGSSGSSRASAFIGPEQPLGPPPEGKQVQHIGQPKQQIVSGRTIRAPAQQIPQVINTPAYLPMPFRSVQASQPRTPILTVSPTTANFERSKTEQTRLPSLAAAVRDQAIVSNQGPLLRDSARHDTREAVVPESAVSIKNRTCSICHKVFNRPSGLRIHMHTHTGEKPYKCNWPMCGKRFSVRSNMIRHLKIHRRKEQKIKSAMKSRSATSPLAESQDTDQDLD